MGTVVLLFMPITNNGWLIFGGEKKVHLLQ